MTPTEIARRSDALYADGTCGMTRRVLCDMVAQRESDLEDARAENAKLRERYYAYEYKMDSLVSSLTGGLLSKSAATPNDVLYSSVVEELTEDQIKENCKLEAENAKLRELLQRTWDAFHDATAREFVRVKNELRELGIEVTS